MISIKINDIKKFMSCLLVGTTFDFLSVLEVSISTFNTFHINGHINNNYFNKDELSEMSDTIFSSWPTLKPICYNLIKGSKTPEKMKISFILPQKNYEIILNECGYPVSSDQIQGLYIHFTYDEKGLYAVAATSLHIFTMDKTLDKHWDNIVSSFLRKNFSIEET